MELTTFTGALALVGAYLCGAIPTGVLIARARGVDLTQVGSGNIGATNVARALGKTTGVIVLLLDAFKGFAPAYIAGRNWLDESHGAWIAAACGLFAILGHVFPIWLRFRGGKGVATGLGVFLALSPIAAAIAAALFAAVYAAKRISSIGSLTATTSMPIVMLVLREPAPYILLAALGWLIIVIRHRGNIRRLLRKEETRV